MRIKTLSAFTLALAATGLLAVGPVAAAPVCYRNSDNYGDPTRIVLDVKQQSRLTARQVVFEADGKHAFLEAGKNRMAVFDGAIVTSRGTAYQPKGAHLGGESYWVRGANPKAAQGGPPSPIVWDCTTAEINAAPKFWYCNISGGIKNPPTYEAMAYNLARVDYKDPLCDTFQDSVEYPPYPPAP